MRSRGMDDIKRRIYERLNEMTARAFLGEAATTYTAPTPQPDVLAALKTARDTLYASLPVLWYTETQTMIPRGKVVRVPSHEPSIGEFFIFHCDDMDEIRALLRGVRLVHLREWRGDGGGGAT